MTPTFILGVPRSGTTLLRVLLDSHSAIASPPETAWITGGYGERSLRELVKYLCDSELGPAKNLSGISSATILGAARQFLEIVFSDYLQARNKRCLVLKTPDDIQYVEFLLTLFPDARFIHIHRDGRDVACSTEQQKGRFFGTELASYGELTVFSAMQRWRDWDSRVRELFSKQQSSYLNISYENLVCEPRAVLEEVTGFIGLTFEPAMIEYSQRPHEYPSWEAGSTDVKQKSSIDAGSVGRWRDELPRHCWQEIDDLHGAYLQGLGYPACNAPVSKTRGAQDEAWQSTETGVDPAKQQILLPQAPGFNLKNQVDEYFGNHRSGWAFAVQSLSPAHNPADIYLNTFVEKSFVWEPQAARAIEEPWVGIIHIPPGVPNWFQGHQSNDAMFASTAWKQSLPHCRGLFTLSEYHKRHLRKCLDVPVNALLHPTEEPELKWSPAAFRSNPDKSIIQVGWWLRVLHAIFELPDTGLEKVLLRARSESFFDDLMQAEHDLRKSKGLFRDSMYETARVVDFLGAGDYDRLLSENIVFLNLYDASANNAVIECIVRNTPVLVNPLEAVVEYLGEDYPLYYHSFEEAAEKAANESLLFAAHEYLKTLPIKKKLTAEYFLNSILDSDIMKLCQSEPRPDTNFPTQIRGQENSSDLTGHSLSSTGTAARRRVGGEQIEEAVSLNKKGELAFNDGNMDLAEARFRQAHELAPDNIEVLNNLVVLHWQKEDLANTLGYLADALELDPLDRDIVMNGGQILAALNREGDAGIIYSSFLERNPDDKEVSRLLSTVTRDESRRKNNTGSPDPAADADVSAESEGMLSARFVDYTVGGEAPGISVVIPSCNQGEFLEETICSVLDQGYPNLELIIMDGGSADQSVDIIKRYEGSISYWKSSPDRGQYRAVEAGLHRSTGEIMTWINSDDKLHPGSLHAIASIFSRSKEVDWITGTPSIMNREGELTWVCPEPPVFSREYYLAKKYDFPCYVQQEGTFWRRSLWEKAGSKLKTSLKMAADLELWMRFFRHSRLYTTDMLLGCFRQHSGQKTDGGLELYRKEALRELNKEAARFKKSNQALPEKAPVIMIADAAASSRDPVQRDSESALTTDGSGDILVTAIVSTYNSEEYIEGCLQDLMSQTIVDQLEVIVVDSGSQQNERIVVERYQEQHPNIRYIRTDERETVYSAWNRAIREARGEFISNANTDDRHSSDAYEKMAAALRSRPGIALVYADSFVTSTANATFEGAAVEGKFQWPEFDERLLFSVCYIGPQPMWRRSLHEKYGYFDAEMKVAGDYDFWLRMVSSERFHHIAEELGLYLLSSASVEHAYAKDGAIESENARQRCWPPEWGERPTPGGSYLVTMDNNADYSGDQEKPAPLVSIIMPTKNRLDLLGRALDSVIAQTYKHWELLVVNDGGDDVSPVVDTRASCGRIRSIRLEQSGGQAAARNIALQEAQGEIICYLDDDDIYLEKHLDTVVMALTREGLPFIYTDAVLVSEQFENGMLTETGERSNPYRHGKYSRDRLLVNNYIPINTWAHWKTCLDEVGVFDESLNCYEDWEFLLRFSARYNFTHLCKTTVEVTCRVDRVDSVTRQRLSESADAFRAIYARHDDSLPAHLVRERSLRLRALEFNAEKQHQALLDTTVDEVDTDTRDAAGCAPDEPRLQVTREQFLRRVEEFSYELPSIHLIMVDVDNDVGKIADTLDSLDQQIYSGWGLSILSTAPSPSREFDALPNMEWLQADDVGQLFIATTQQSDCGWIASVMPGDRLEPDALSVFVDYINQNPGWRFIYSDEDCVDVSGSQVNHKFKPDVNPDYLCSSPYTGNLSLVHRDMLGDISPDTGLPVASFFDLALKVLEQHGVSAIGHVPVLLYHQLQENEQYEARDTWVKPVLEAYVRRNNIDASVLAGATAGTCMIDYACSGSSDVCIAIYAGSDVERVEHTVVSLLSKTACSGWTIRVGIDRALALQLEKYRSDQLSIDPLDKGVSRCAYLDSLAQTIDADYLVFMDPGVVVLQANWLERLLAQGQRPEVGVVGVRLLSPQKRIVHAGILTGIGSFAVGGCIGEGDALEQEGYMQRSQVVQNLSAVSSACMLVKRSLYQSVQGFNAEIAVQLYRDVDFCLRIGKTGKNIVWTPFVTMLISDERLDTYTGDDGINRVEKDARKLGSKWLQSFARDPAYNRNLTLARADFGRETDFRPVWDPAIRDLPRITGCGFGSYGTWAYRVAQPLDALSAAGKARYSHVPFRGRTLDHMPSAVEMERMQPDVLLLQNSLHDHCLDSLRQYRKSNSMLMVLGQDDLMFAIPPKSSCFKQRYKDIKKRLRTCLSLVDRLVVTNEALADELSGFINDIRIVPNHLDTGIWGELESRRGCSIKPRVGWAGAMQHHGDLEILADAVRETAEEVDWIFMGMCPEFLRPYVREVHEYVAFSSYPAALAKLNLDLAVAPLERNRFNRCKSNLRILEYGAMGWPVIATDIEPYRRGPVHLVGNQTQAWVNAIRDHVNDLEATWKAGDALRQWVQENHLLQLHLDDWLTALDSACGSNCRSLTPGKASGL